MTQQVKLSLNDYEVILGNGLLQTRGPDADIARDLGKRFAELIRSPRGQRIPRQLLTGDHEQIEDVETRLVNVLQVPPARKRRAARRTTTRSKTPELPTITTVCEPPDPPTDDQCRQAIAYGLPVSSSISSRVMERRIEQFERTKDYVDKAWRALAGRSTHACGVPQEEVYRMVRQIMRNAVMMRRIDMAERGGASEAQLPSPDPFLGTSIAADPIVRDIALLLRHRWSGHTRKPWYLRLWPSALTRRPVRTKQ
jgi:hypothetical protein